MTLNEFLQLSYAWADQHALLILLASLLLPLAGTLLAWIGKGGRTDADGRFIASAVMAMAFAGVLLEVAAIFVARGVSGAGVFVANVLLLASPVVCLAGSILGIRLVFPLSELGSVRTALDVGLFVAGSAGVLWLLSKFRGWGVFFLGGLGQLVGLGLLALFVLWRLYRRASRGSAARAMARPPAPTVLPAPGVRSALGVPLMALAVVAVSAGLLLGVYGYTRSAATTVAPPAADLAAAEVPTRVEPAPVAFRYTDRQGVEHFVSRLEDVPEELRAGAKPMR